MTLTIRHGSSNDDGKPISTLAYAIVRNLRTIVKFGFYRLPFLALYVTHLLDDHDDIGPG